MALIDNPARTNLELLRRYRGLSQAAVAAAAKVDRAQLSRYEHGLEPSPAVRARLAAALDMDPDALLERP